MQCPPIPRVRDCKDRNFASAPVPMVNELTNNNCTLLPCPLNPPGKHNGSEKMDAPCFALRDPPGGCKGRGPEPDGR